MTDLHPKVSWNPASFALKITPYMKQPLLPSHPAPTVYFWQIRAHGCKLKEHLIPHESEDGDTSCGDQSAVFVYSVPHMDFHIGLS